ncbi:hypothetical protein PIB30_100772, partial [Stylosanthes scabra]|nr:hypothetical protein [Stylosanthes scabra]
MLLFELDGKGSYRDVVEDVRGEGKKKLVEGKEEEFEGGKPNEEEGGGPTYTTTLRLGTDGFLRRLWGAK